MGYLTLGTWRVAASASYLWDNLCAGCVLSTNIFFNIALLKLATIAAGCRPEVCPADAALSRTSVTKDNVLLGGSTSCLLRELCLAAGDDFFDALVAPLAAPSPDDALLAAAEAMFDARVAAAAAAAREPPVRDLLHPSCFRRPPPRGFGA